MSKAAELPPRLLSATLEKVAALTLSRYSFAGSPSARLSKLTTPPDARLVMPSVKAGVTWPLALFLTSSSTVVEKSLRTWLL